MHGRLFVDIFFNSWINDEKIQLAQAFFSFLFHILRFTWYISIFACIISRPIKSMIICLPSNYVVTSFNLVQFTLSEFLTFNSCSICIFLLSYFFQVGTIFNSAADIYFPPPSSLIHFLFSIQICLETKWAIFWIMSGRFFVMYTFLHTGNTTLIFKLKIKFCLK